MITEREWWAASLPNRKWEQKGHEIKKDSKGKAEMVALWTSRERTK